METYYGQRRTYFHNVRFSGVQEKNLQERRKKFRIKSVSEFIRAAVLDDEIKVVTEVHQDPLDFRMRRAQDDFQKAIKCPGVDPEFIEAQAYRLRLIGAALGGKIERMIRFMEGKRPG